MSSVPFRPLAQLSFLERRLQCHACNRRIQFNVHPERFTGSVRCRCGCHWWATWFHAGSIRAQLLEDYNGDQVWVTELMQRFKLPESVTEPAYWQIRLEGDLRTHFVDHVRFRGPRGLHRSRRLLTWLLDGASHHGGAGDA